MENGIAQIGKDFGCKASNQAPDSGDAAVQNKIMEDLIAENFTKDKCYYMCSKRCKSNGSRAGKANEKGIITIGYEGTTMENIS